MFKPLSLYIGLRYVIAKKYNNFVSFISIISILGITLGVAILITVLSVMNGFDYEIRDRIFSFARQVTVYSNDGLIKDWIGLKKNIESNHDIISSAPVVIGQGMLTNDKIVNGIEIIGILPNYEKKISRIHEHMISGDFSSLKDGCSGIILGQSLANSLHISSGDKITLITSNNLINNKEGIIPNFKQFTVLGIFHVSDGFGYDTNCVFINMYDAQKLFNLNNRDVTGINIKINNLYRGPVVSEKLNKSLDEKYYAVDWTQKYGAYFKAIKMEKTIMFVILLFIITVAIFNLISSLVMTVNEKQFDIAILRTFGATQKMIIEIFVIQGLMIGIIGTLFGIFFGILLAIYAPFIVKILEHILNTNFISDSVYCIDVLPSKLELSDILYVGSVTILMSLLATIYPAWRASKILPANTLKYE